MKISQVRIRRYRSIVDLELHLDDYTALVGANGVGKSSILYALDWFFNGGTLSRADAHETAARPYDPANSDIDVEVTFVELTDNDRAALGRYGRGMVCRLRRTWNAESGAEKMFGNSMGGPGFRAVEAATPIAAMRRAYRSTREEFSELPDVLTKADIAAALAAWEDDPANRDRLVEVPADDASHMFGIGGAAVLSRCIRYVLVPASTELAAELGQATKGSALQQLLGNIAATVANAEIQQWTSANSEVIAGLAKRVESQVDAATTAHSARVNALLGDLVPSAKLTLVPTYPDWLPRADVTVRAQISVNGQRTDVGRQGHGTQRALLLAVLQSLVPAGDEPAGHSPDRFPALVVSIEEPEIFQHPVRARHFARVLSSLSSKPGAQVLLATHSPYFVLPEQVESLRRCRLEDDGTAVDFTSVGKIAALTDRGESQVLRNLEKAIPTAFSEAFFAETVLLVEGDTDRVLVEALSARLGLEIDANGTCIISVGGKQGLRTAYALLRSIGVEVYVLVDGDSGKAERKHPNPGEDQQEVWQSTKKATDDVVSWLLSDGATAYTYGEPTRTTERWTFLQDDLEMELEGWPEFCSELGSLGASLRGKDVAAYRAAALAAGMVGLPESLRDLMDSIHKFSQNARLDPSGEPSADEGGAG